MSIEVIAEGNVLRVIESSEPLIDGSHLRLFTEPELLALQAQRQSALDLQMGSFIRGDEDEDGKELF